MGYGHWGNYNNYYSSRNWGTSWQRGGSQTRKPKDGWLVCPCTKNNVLYVDEKPDHQWYRKIKSEHDESAGCCRVCGLPWGTVAERA